MTIQQVLSSVPVCAVHLVIRVIGVTEAEVLDGCSYLCDLTMDPTRLNLL
jgi:hypothetical protein